MSTKFSNGLVKQHRIVHPCLQDGIKNYEIKTVKTG